MQNASKIKYIICLLSLFVTVSIEAVDDLVRVDCDSISAYVRSCRKANGAFGPRDQEYTDAAWNFPAVATLNLLHVPIENSAAILEHGVSFPPGPAGYGHWQFFLEHQLRSALGKPMVPKCQQVTLIQQDYHLRYYGSPWGTDDGTLFKGGGISQLDPRDLSAESIGFYNISSLYYVLASAKASGRTVSNQEPLVQFILRRQAPCGGFADVRSANGTALDGDAHIVHTYQAISSLELLHADIPNVARCAEFIASCCDEKGGYRYNPQRDVPGNVADIYYTWAGIKTLKQIRIHPKHIDTTLHWINELHNSDGGFGDQPGWRSRLFSTFYAVDALQTVGEVKAVVESKMSPRKKKETLVGGPFKIYQALFKMPLCDSKDLVDLQRRKINLLALKSEKFSSVTPLLTAIRERALPMDVVLCPEMYPHRMLRGGGVMLDHVGNFMLDSRWNDSQMATWKTADKQGRTGLIAREYGRQVIAPMRQLGSFCYPEQDFEMEMAYSAYDAGVLGTSGYNAVLTGFNWAPRDFVRVFPWRERYVDKLVPIADVDAHGALKEWSPQLNYTRDLFIAKGPTFSDFQQAAAAGRVVCVIAQPFGVASGVTYYGQQAAVDYVKQHISEWQWWK